MLGPCQTVRAESLPLRAVGVEGSPAGEVLRLVAVDVSPTCEGEWGLHGGLCVGDWD